MIFAAWPDLLPERHRLRTVQKKLVLANGCFDLLHAGHIDLLEQAERMELLDGLAAVDYVCSFDEPTPRELIQAILPDVLVKGADWGPGQIVGSEEVEAAGGRVVRIPLVAGRSTTNIVARVLALP